jgi:glycerol transport system substrate-binding protein
VPAQGQIAQQIFWYTAFTADMTKKGLPVVNADGTPKWRMAPSPTARTGSRACRTATRTWARGPSSRTPIRTAGRRLALRAVRDVQDRLAEEVADRPDLHPRQRHPHEYLTKNADKYGGLIEFYRSPARVAWTPTGTNVPDYPKLAQLWWKNVARP